MGGTTTVRCRAWLAVLAILPCLAATPAAANDRRAAVVVGIAAYRDAPLDNPLNDARLIASTLVDLGFEVRLLEDVASKELPALLDLVGSELKDAGIGVFYYAGHAIQSQGVNRLLASDVEPTSLAAVLERSLPITDIVDRMSRAGAGISLLVLDACRNNPFVEADPGLRSGLASIEQAAGELLIGYATSAGQVALDAGNGRNSPYTAALAQALAEPGRDIEQVFRAVRREVREVSGGRQIPWVSGSLESRLVLREARPADEALPAAGGITVEWVWWQLIQNSRDPLDLYAFLDVFPGSELASSALARMADAGPARIVRGLRSASEPAPAAGPRTGGAPPGDIVAAATGERVPPAALRAWPRALPTVDRGLGGMVTSCDELAADPDDPGRLTPGVRIGVVDIKSALRACGAAVVRDPSSGRLLFQLARTLDAAHRYGWAREFYEQAGATGWAQAWTNLGFLYLQGRLGPVDAGKALELYQRAAALGNPRARTNVGTMFLRGQGVPRSAEEAVLWYRLAGSMGWPNAINALADVYRRGDGLPKDEAAALGLYRSAAEVGQTDAMSSLGRAYLEGWGVEPDLAASVSWLGRANELGNRFAAFHLGRLHEAGRGVRKDPRLARDLYELSAERGFAEARLAVASLYTGRALGKPQPERAWYELRLAQEAKLAAAAERLDALRPKLGEAARQRAETRVQRWLEQNGL